MHDDDPEFPADTRHLRADHDIWVVITRDHPNEEYAPFVNWRIAVYSVNNLAFALRLLDGYIRHRVLHPLRNVDRRPYPALGDIAVHVYPHMNIDVVQIVEQFTMPNKTCHEPERVLPLNILTVYPPTGARMLRADIEVDGPENFIISFTGSG